MVEQSQGLMCRCPLGGGCHRAMVMAPESLTTCSLRQIVLYIRRSVPAMPPPGAPGNLPTARPMVRAGRSAARTAVEAGAACAPDMIRAPARCAGGRAAGNNRALVSRTCASGGGAPGVATFTCMFPPCYQVLVRTSTCGSRRGRPAWRRRTDRARALAVSARLPGMARKDSVPASRSRRWNSSDSGRSG